VVVNSGFYQYAFARNSRNDLIYYVRYPSPGSDSGTWWPGSAAVWNAGNLTQKFGVAFQITGDLHAVADSNSWGIHVFGRNANNELIHYYWNHDTQDTDWHAENLTIAWPHVGLFFNIIDGLTVTNGPDGNSLHAFGRNADHELVHYYRLGQAAWRADILTFYSGIGSAFLM
jgi:hypothetical protein